MTRKDALEWLGPRPRRNSGGLFGSHPPQRPTRIDISEGVIINNCAKKTLLGAIRGIWPVGVYTWSDIVDKHPNYVGEVMDNFGMYFRHERGQSRSEAAATILKHIKAVCKRTLYEEKKRCLKKSKRLEELKPYYLSDKFLVGLLEFWKSDALIQRSTFGIENRKKLVTLHSSRARPFKEVENKMRKENNGVPPMRLQVWDKTHIRAGTELDENGRPTTYTFSAAIQIAARYASILNEMNFDATSLKNRLEPFDCWLQATTSGLSKPKKGRLIGYPRVPAR